MILPEIETKGIHQYFVSVVETALKSGLKKEVVSCYPEAPIQKCHFAHLCDGLNGWKKMRKETYQIPLGEGLDAEKQTQSPGAPPK